MDVPIINDLKQDLVWCACLMTNIEHREGSKGYYAPFTFADQQKLYFIVRSMMSRNNNNDDLKKDMAKTISNLAEVGDEEFLDHVCKDAEMVSIVLEYADSTTGFDEHSELLLSSFKILGCLFSSANPAAIDLFLEKEILELFYKQLIKSEGVPES